MLQLPSLSTSLLAILSLLPLLRHVGCTATSKSENLRRAVQLRPATEDAELLAAENGQKKRAAWRAFQDMLGEFLSSDPEMLPPPEGLRGNETIIVTSAGKDKLSYVDSAVMLGLSLSQRVPEISRVCIVQQTMPEAYQRLLQSAGWALIQVEDFVPAHILDEPGWDFWLSYWMGSFVKVNAFRLPSRRTLFLDADTYVWSSALEGGVLRNMSIPVADDGSNIAMVEDVNGVNYNSGVLLFCPSLPQFRKVVEHMDTHAGWGGLDQPAINHVFDGHIFPLDRRYNVHGRHWQAEDCGTAIVSHYTGNPKPAKDAWQHLNSRVSTGHAAFEDVASLQCPNLYQAYYCDLLSNAGHLSDSLQEALRLTRDCNASALRPPYV